MVRFILPFERLVGHVKALTNFLDVAGDAFLTCFQVE